MKQTVLQQITSIFKHRSSVQLSGHLEKSVEEEVGRILEFHGLEFDGVWRIGAVS